MESSVQEILRNSDCWRERLPNKYEDLTTWKNIIGQRNFISVII